MIRKIKSLKARKAKIDAELKRLEAKEKEAARKRRNRQLMLWGIVVEQKIKKGELKSDLWAGQCLDVLTSERDLKAATEGLILENQSR